jgi:hypothetical protein
MASIYKEVILDVDAEVAWRALRNVGGAARLFSPVLTNGRVDGDVRTVQFANGMSVDERIVTIDDDRRRVAYAAIKGTPLAHHHASMQIVPDGDGRCRFVWITDLLPDDAEPAIRSLVEQGAAALKQNLEAAR